jgi:hypothetical protein
MSGQKLPIPIVFPGYVVVVGVFSEATCEVVLVRTPGPSYFALFALLFNVDQLLLLFCPMNLSHTTTITFSLPFPHGQTRWNMPSIRVTALTFSSHNS